MPAVTVRPRRWAAEVSRSEEGRGGGGGGGCRKVHLYTRSIAGEMAFYLRLEVLRRWNVPALLLRIHRWWVSLLRCVDYCSCFIVVTIQNTHSVMQHSCLLPVPIMFMETINAYDGGLNISLPRPPCSLSPDKINVLPYSVGTRLLTTIQSSGP